MIKGKMDGLPIVYESKKSDKVIVDSRDDKKQVEGQLNGYNSKVGFATNISSSLYCMLEEFPKGSPEHETILKRLKIGRGIQGEIIDGVKGLTVPPFREHWTKYKKITEDMTPGEKEKWEFNNKVLCQKRPSFFRFLYAHYMKRYNQELKRYNIYSLIAFNMSFDDLCKYKDKTDEQHKVVNNYVKRSFFIENDSIVNQISRYMRANLGLIGKYSSKQSRDFDYKVLINKEHELNLYALSQMKSYLQEYKTFKKGMRHHLYNSYDNLDSFIAYLRKECALNITSNESELADYAIEVTYGSEVSMVEFCWKMFPQGLIQNILINSSEKIIFSVKDTFGTITYLWDNYSMREFSLEEINEK